MLPDDRASPSPGRWTAGVAEDGNVLLEKRAMAKAIWDGKECDVRVDTDLEANWSVSILSGEFDPVSLIKRPAAPLIMKLRAKSRWLALDAGLRTLKAQGKIADYTIEPRPQEEIDAENAEKARLAAKKAAGAKAVAEEEEAE